MIGWSFDTEHLSIIKDEDGNTTGFQLNVNEIDILLEPFDWEEADKRVVTAILVILLKFREELYQLLKNNGISKQGTLQIDVMKISSFKEHFLQYFPYGGMSIEDLEEMIIQTALIILNAPQLLQVVVRDDIELELFLDDNIMLSYIMSRVIGGLLEHVCDMDHQESFKIASKFIMEVLPKEPKIHTHATALAILGSLG